MATMGVGPRTSPCRHGDVVPVGPIRSRPSANECDHAEMDLSLHAAHGVERARWNAAWTVSGCTATVVGGALVAAVAEHGSGTLAGLLPNSALAIGTAVLGAVVLTRYPGHLLGRLFAVFGLSQALGVAALAWRIHVLGGDPGPSAAQSWLQACVVLPATAVAPVIVALFPDGRLPRRRWCIVPWLALASLAVYGLAVPLAVWRGDEGNLITATATWGSLDPWAFAAFAVATALTLAAFLLALLAMLERVRTSTGDLRQQVKWFGLGVSAALVLSIAGLVLDSWILTSVSSPVGMAGVLLGILRYRLYEIDRLLGRTLAYVLTTAGLVAVFAALDVTLAVVVGGDSTVIAACSAFAVALLLRPARDIAQDVVDRVFDRRGYAATRQLRELGQRAGSRPVAPADLVAALRVGLGDPDLTMYFYDRHSDRFLDVAGRTVSDPPIGPEQILDPVGRGEETLAVVVHSDRDPGLFLAVLRSAAVALEHARLQAELLAKVTEVEDSRHRLVAAGAAERRRIERDLHDGAQQRLVGLALHVQAERRRGAFGPEVDELLGFAVDQINSGVLDIRSLVRGVMPSALVTGGLPAALSEAGYPPHVTVRCAVPVRLDPDVEAAAWFVLSEAVANAIKHAPDCPVEVGVCVNGARLVVEVVDRGPGGADPSRNGLRGLADRVAAHGGRLELVSPPGGGTRMRVELPCE